MRAVRALLLVSALLLTACAEPPGEPAEVLARAIQAHGGREALSRLDNLRVESEVLYKGQLRLQRTIDWQGPENWSMTLRGAGGLRMRLGMAAGECWRQNQYLAVPCTESDRLEHQRIAALHRARLLHRIEPEALRPARSMMVDGRYCPAIQAGETTLVFDPQTHRLAQIRLEDRVDRLSEYREVQGAMVAAHRVLTIAGALDVEETWREILPGGADAAALQAPELPRPGLVIQDTDPARPVASMSVEDPDRDIQAAIDQLDAFIRRQGFQPSASDAVILTAPDTGAPAGDSWRVSVIVEANRRISPVEERGLVLDERPDISFLGMFERGDVAQVYAHAPEVTRRLEERNRTPASGAGWEILVSRDALREAPADRLSLLRIGVE